MDEDMNEGFAIPGKKPMFGEEDTDLDIGGEPLFKSFANEDGTKAVVLATVDAMADEGEEKIANDELESYAQELFDGGDDYRDLKVGDMYEGETAKADADAEATRLDEEYNPGDDATIDELVSAIDDAKADTTVDEENELSEAEAMPPEPPEGGPTPPMGGRPPMGGKPPIGGATPPMGGEAPAPEGEEPMLDQLKKAKKPF